MTRKQFRSWLKVKLSNMTLVLDRAGAQIDAYKDEDFVARLETILKEAKRRKRTLTS